MYVQQSKLISITFRIYMRFNTNRLHRNMYGMLYLVDMVSVVVVMTSGVRGGTGGDKYNTCAVKCDLVKEVTLLKPGVGHHPVITHTHLSQVDRVA